MMTLEAGARANDLTFLYLNQRCVSDIIGTDADADPLPARKRTLLKGALSQRASPSSSQTGAWSLAFSRPRRCRSTPLSTSWGKSDGDTSR